MLEFKKMYKELQDMIEILNTTIEINANEEQFYRRSAASTTSEVSKSLFLEIADEVERYLNNMRARRQKLWDAQADLKSAEKKAQ